MTLTRKLKPLAIGTLIASSFILGWQTESHAQNVTIDNFTELGVDNTTAGGGALTEFCSTLVNNQLNQCVLPTGDPGNDSDVQTLPGILGGSRELGINPLIGTSMQLGITDNNTLSWSNADGNQSSSFITWDNSGNGINFDASGFDAISAFVISLDLNVTLAFTLTSGLEGTPESATVQVTEDGTSSLPSFFEFSFSDFQVDNPNINLIDIDRITLALSGPVAVDTSVDLVEFQMSQVEMPEPSTVLSILGLGVLGKFRSRKKKDDEKNV